LQPFIDAAKKANQVVVIDGCPVGCAEKVLEHVELSPVSYVLTQMGLEKGKTEVINEICDKIKADFINSSK